MAKSVYIVVTPFFPTPTNWRGPFCFDFVKALKRELEERKLGGGGHWNVLVFKEGDGGDYEIAGVTVHTFRARRLPSNVFPNLFAQWNQRSFMRKLADVLDVTAFDSVKICHAHTANYGIYPLAVKKVNPKCKTLLHHHDPQSFGLNMGRLRNNWLYNLIEFPILRRMHERIDCHVFISEMVKRSFLSAPDTHWTHYWDYKRQMRGLPYRSVRIKDSIVLHNGVDTSIFHPIAQSRPSTPTFTIGCIGNFIDWKDQEILIRAAGLIAERGLPSGGVERIDVSFIGSGPLLKHCKRIAADQRYFL